MKSYQLLAACVLASFSAMENASAQNISINTTGAANSTLSMLEVLQISTTASTRGLHVAHSGAITGTGYGLWVEKTGASTTNIAGYFNATGGTDNYAGIFENGSVGIGTLTPLEKFHTSGGNMLLDPSYFLYGLSLGTTRVAMIGMTPGAFPIPGFMRIGDGSANYTDLSILTSSYGSSAVNIISGTTSNSIAYFKENGNVAIGTTVPTQKLEVYDGNILLSNSGGLQGELRLAEAAIMGTNYISLRSPGALASNVNYTLPLDAGTAGQQLQTDGTGNLSWASAGGVGGDWTLLGNGNTVDGINFIGSTNDVPITIKVNNQQAGRIEGMGSNLFLGFLAGVNNIATYNSAFGWYSLNANTNGGGNAAFGPSSLRYNITGNDNTAFGRSALVWNVAGSRATAIGNGAMLNANNQPVAFLSCNVAVGYSALSGSMTPSANTGNYNTALGYQTLSNNTSGSYNIAVGLDALYSNTATSGNIAIGDSALYTQAFTTAFSSENVAIGNSALFRNNPVNIVTGRFNTAVGSRALRNNTQGFQNTAYGHSAIYSNTNGNNNTAIGYISLYSNTTGDYNTANGAGALYLNTTGASNTANGHSALFGNTTAGQNTAIGREALFTQGTLVAAAWNSDNTALGYRALYTNNPTLTTNGLQNTAVGSQALYTNSVGSNNTALGYLAGYTSTAANANTTGSNNTFLGYNTGFASVTQRSNATAIGYNAKVDASNALILGGTGADAVSVGIGTTSPLTKVEVKDASAPTLRLSSCVGCGGFSNAVNSGSIELLESDGVFATSSTGFQLKYDGSANQFQVLSAAGGAAFTSMRIARGTGITDFNVSADGIILNFQSAGVTQGSISVAGATVSYNAFTGSHYAITHQNIERGMLVSMTGINEHYHGNPKSEILYGVIKSAKANDSKIVGSYLGLLRPDSLPSLENPHQIMAVGNGEMWVIDNGENINPGDYLISSSIAGHATKDIGNYDVAYIIAKVAEPVDWTTVTETVNDVKHKLISVFYENFTINHKAESLQIELDKLKSEIENIKTFVGLDQRTKN